MYAIMTPEPILSFLKKENIRPQKLFDMGFKLVFEDGKELRKATKIDVFEGMKKGKKTASLHAVTEMHEDKIRKKYRNDKSFEKKPIGAFWSAVVVHFLETTFEGGGFYSRRKLPTASIRPEDYPSEGVYKTVRMSQELHDFLCESKTDAFAVFSSVVCGGCTAKELKKIDISGLKSYQKTIVVGVYMPYGLLREFRGQELFDRVICSVVHHDEARCVVKMR